MAMGLRLKCLTNSEDFSIPIPGDCRVFDLHVLRCEQVTVAGLR